MSNEDGTGTETKIFKFKGHGKYILKYRWTVIKKEGKDDKEKVTTVSFDNKTIPVNEQEKVSVKIELIDTNNQFLVAIPKEGEAIIVRKPNKIDIFVSDLELAKNITDLLNRIKEGWTSSLWCTDPKSIKVSAIIIMSEEEISEKIIPLIEGIIPLIEGIIPLIEGIMKKFYGDEK